MSARVRQRARGVFGSVCRGRGILFSAACAWLFAAGPARAGLATGDGAEKKNPDPQNIFGRVAELAKGLRGPDGIACDPESGNVYVAEENAAAIVCVKRNGAKQVLFDGSTPLYETRGGVSRKVAGLRSPEGLAA